MIGLSWEEVYASKKLMHGLKKAIAEQEASIKGLLSNMKKTWGEATGETN
jgi:hypothetical protein